MPSKRLESFCKVILSLTKDIKEEKVETKGKEENEERSPVTEGIKYIQKDEREVGRECRLIG